MGEVKRINTIGYRGFISTMEVHGILGNDVLISRHGSKSIRTIAELAKSPFEFSDKIYTELPAEVSEEIELLREKIDTYERKLIELYSPYILETEEDVKAYIERLMNDGEVEGN